MSKVVIIVLLFVLTSCASRSVKILDESIGNKKIEKKQVSFFFFGFYPSEVTLEEKNICKRGKRLSYIEYETKPSDFIYRLLTLGVYSPKTLSYVCR